MKKRTMFILFILFAIVFYFIHFLECNTLINNNLIETKSINTCIFMKSLSHEGKILEKKVFLVVIFIIIIGMFLSKCNKKDK